MKPVASWMLAAALAVGPLFAQNPNSNGNGNSQAAAAPSNGNGNSNAARSADVDWTAVVSLATPAATPASPQTRRTTAQAATEAQQRAQQAREAATRAREFYVANPTHVNAGEAKKLEALTALQGVQDGDLVYENSARAIATSYRGNSSNSAVARFEVAVVAERVGARSRLGGSAFGNNPAELELIADRLLIEFGDLPEAHYFYASVARTADMARAGRMADKLLRSSGAPAAAKEEARSIRAKLDLLGTTFSTQLRSTDAGIINLAQQTGKLTVLYVWPVRDGVDGMGALRAGKRSLARDVQVVYLPLGASAQQARALESRRPLPGPICADAQESTTPLAELCRVRHSPYVYILDRTAKLQAFGPASELSALIAAAGR